MENQKIVLYYEISGDKKGFYNTAPSDASRKKFNKYDLQELFDKNNGKDVEIKCFKDKQECGLVKGKITTKGFDSLEGNIKYDSENSCSGSFYYFINHNELALNGRGKKIFYGRVYEGSFINTGRPQGWNTTLTYTNGNVYEGDFGVYELPDGEGKLKYTNGNVYEGEFKDGIPTGKGKLTCKDGDVHKDKFDILNILNMKNQENNIDSESEETVSNDSIQNVSEETVSNDSIQILDSIDSKEINNNNANQAGEPSIKNQCILF